MTADRGVNAAHRIRQFGQQRRIERLTHAVQALKLVALDAAGVLDDAGDGERVVGGELRVKAIARRDQLLDAGHVAEVGHGLAREHRIVGKPALLSALDLGVPIGAFHQADGYSAAYRASHLLDPADDRKRALLIRLHGKPKSVPAAQRWIGDNGADDFERQFQPVGFLGIHGELQLARLGHAREFEKTRRKLSDHPLARDRFKARMQRREFY